MKIVIGSVLKPLDDVRHYHKLGLSLAKISNANLFIAARATPYQADSKRENICFHAISPVQPRFIQRLLAPFKFGVYLLKVKPAIIIACTHELLIVIILYRIIFGAKILYDVQENYALNLQENKRFPSWLTQLLSYWIRAKERLCTSLVSQFWLAETCYLEEMPFMRPKATVFENKSLFFGPPKDLFPASLPLIRLLFSGTIAKENGIFEAVQLAVGLHAIDARYQLHIIGCCHNASVEKEIRLVVSPYSEFIHLKISSIPFGYEAIQETIAASHIGLVPYRPQRNFRDKIPTKLYEYTAASLGIVLQDNSIWTQFCAPFQNALSIDFQQIDAMKIHTGIQNLRLMPATNSDQSLFWVSEEEKLREAVQALNIQ